MATDSELSHLVDDLRAASAGSRRKAAERLADMGKDACGALPALLSAASDSNAPVRRAVIRALGVIGAEDEQVIAVVAKALADPQQSVRVAALDILRALGPRAVVAVPALVARLGHPVWIEIPQVLSALSAIGPVASPAGPHLLDLLCQMPPELLADFSSGSSGPGAEGAAELWWNLIRVSAAEALATMRYDPAAVIPRLVDGVRTPNVPGVREGFVRAIGRYGLLAASAVETLVETLRSDQEPIIRKAVLGALNSMGPLLQPALPHLQAMVKDHTDMEARFLATQALGMLGPDARPALRTLEALVQEGVPEAREVALWAYRRITLQQPALVAHEESGVRFLEPTPDWSIGEPRTDRGVWFLPLWHEVCQIRATLSFSAATDSSRSGLLHRVVQELQSFFDRATIADPVEVTINDHPCQRIFIADGDRHDGTQAGVVYVFYQPGWQFRLRATMPIASGPGAVAAIGALARHVVWGPPTLAVVADVN